MAENQNFESSGGDHSTSTPTPQQQAQKQQSKPRDGPATVFEADPMVSDIFTGQDGDYFGLVLVANWPPSPTSDMEGPYQDFLGAVKSCFRDEDVVAAATSSDTTSTDSTASLPSVYLYPTRHLHITVATFVPATKIVGKNNTNSFSTKELRDAKRAQALDLLQAASKLPEWPTEPLQLVVDSAQIGKRAGILLWKDLSGGIAAIRNCLRTASTEASIPIIPGIIHSTFLRFSRTPQTPGEKVQEAFESKIKGRLGTDFFHDADSTTSSRKPLVLRANTVKLACESTPYMHIPKDDEHVLWSTELTTR